MLAGSAWKFTADDEGQIYRIQVNNVDTNNRSVVEKSLQDWKQSGEGWSNEGQILFFVKKFPDTEKWEEWISRFKDFNLDILDREGKPKKIIKVKQTQEQSLSTKRVCSKCKQTNHNAATCGDFHRKQTATQVIVPNAVFAEEKGKRTCSKCNQKGHNARSCKNEGIP